jgi:hypothetical protein
MKSAVGFRVSVTETQAELLQERLAALPFKVAYQEEQHGAALVAIVGCTATQEKPLRDLLNELGAVLVPPPNR